MAPKLRALYDKIAAFKVEDLFSRHREPGPPRTVYINKNLPGSYYEKGVVKKEHVYASNQVITSKYTVLTFIPRNILEQFRRVANVFFLCIAILQFFPKFSTISPGLVMLPLIIVLGITAGKDGYEDVKRHQSDKRVNHTLVRALSGGGWENPNAMVNKSKTFVRGLIPKGRTSKRIKGKAGPEMDLEGNLHAVQTRGTEVEFDDEAATEGNTSRASHLFHRDKSTTSHWKKTPWEDIRVGDFLKIHEGEPLPADLLICATSEEENVAFVETKNLDGETNLKSRNAVPGLVHLRTAEACASKENSFRVDCDRPDVNMYRLNAAVLAGETTMPVDLSMTLLRGTVLRNTAWVIGVVMYSGEDTKIVLNSGGTPSKRSKVEREMNPQVFINLAILAIMAIVCAIVDSILEMQYFPLNAPWLYGADRADDNPRINGLITWAFALITFQNIVPISLYISIEFVRTCQALFIYFDKDIWYEKTNQATLARSWNLSDDLGQIEYIFSDKTGTLTQNSMVFRQCSVSGRVYKGDPESEETLATPANAKVSSSTTRTSNDEDDEDSDDVRRPPKAEIHHFRDESLARDLADAVSADPDSDNAPHARNLNGFWSVLALCHTVLTTVDPETGAIEYKAQSPDEAALVQAAADVGYIFRGRDREMLKMQTPFSEELERYELLNILEFTSARKRMSVILRKEGDDGRLFLLSKGADNVIFERLKEGGEELKKVTEKHLDEFASEGLRTLTLAYKVINEDQYAAWSERYHEATVAMEDREERIEAISDEIEHDLRLLGATAIEDRLQDGVPETIADLKRAGIKIWVATGDKLETAIAIGHSTNLIGRDSNVIVIRGGNDTGRPIHAQMVQALEEFFPEAGLGPDLAGDGTPIDGLPRSSSDGQPALHRVNTGISSIVGSDNGERPGGFVLVVDGTALGFALGDAKHKATLLHLATQCEGVICCRVSPLQKALVVKLVKDGLGAMTLAIGDGANDVSMIQAADVGVGISGEEGLQAVNSSDYAIAQFRFLKKLILVHGHWSYARNGNMILNFFYKNIICIGVLWWFQIYDAWSSNYVFEYTYILFWNSFWTIAPVIGIGVFDRLIDSDVLMKIPELYRYGREGAWFGIRSFIVYMTDGIYQSAIIFFLIMNAYRSTSARTDGYSVGLYEFSTTMAISTVMIASMFNGLNTNVWTGWVFFALLFGPVFVWCYTAVYSAIRPGWFVTPAYGNNSLLFPSAYFWLCMPLVICLSLAPRYLYKAYRFCIVADDLDTLRYIRKMHPNRDLSFDGRPAGGLAHMKQPTASLASRMESVGDISMDARRSMVDPRSASRTDMSTGMRSNPRGFEFDQEEGGVAMSRMQSRLSERRQSSRNLTIPQTRARSGSGTMFANIRKKMSTSKRQVD